MSIHPTADKLLEYTIANCGWSARGMPTLAALSLLAPDEWLIVLDAVIDRTLTNDRHCQEIEQILQPHVFTHRWIERQMQSVERLPPLLPWFIRARRVHGERSDTGINTSGLAGSTPAPGRDLSVDLPELPVHDRCSSPRCNVDQTCQDPQDCLVTPDHDPHDDHLMVLAEAEGMTAPGCSICGHTNGEHDTRCEFGSAPDVRSLLGDHPDVGADMPGGGANP